MKYKAVKKITTFAFVVLAIIYGSLTAEENNTKLSLAECINYAKQNNREIKKAILEENQSSSKIKEVIGSGLPQVTLTGNIVDNIELPTTLFPMEYFGGAKGTFMESKMGVQYNYTFNLEATQMIFNGSFWVGLDAAKYSNQYYSQNVTNTVEETIYSVAVAYYKTISVYKQKELLNKNKLLIEKSLSDTKLMYDNGKAKIVDVDRLNVNYNNIKYQIKKIEEALSLSLNNLKYLMGMDVKSEIELHDKELLSDQDEPKLFNEFEVKENFNIQNRADYKILETVLELQKLNRENVWAQYVPSITAYGSFSYQGLRNKFDLFDANKKWYSFYSVGLRMRFPLFTGGQTLAKDEQAMLEIEKVKQDIANAENGINMQVDNAADKLKTALENAKINYQNMELAKKVLDDTILEYKEGVTNALFLVDSETKLREAQTNFTNSLLELYIAKLDIEKAKGTISNYLNENVK